MISSNVRDLVAKELRELRRSRGALASATLIPTFLLLVMPLGQFLALRFDGGPTDVFTRFLLPLFVAVGGLIVPAMTATYTVVAERERRSLELLMALPVRVGDILLAKLLTLLIVSGLTVVPLFVVDAATLLAFGVIGMGDVALLTLVLMAGTSASIGMALLMALLARDYRTANNLFGAILGPLVIATVVILMGWAGWPRLVVLASLLLGVGAIATIAALRWVTFERYLT